jgi:hypothetical protein
MDESMYEESELMQQLIKHPEKSGPEPEKAGYLPTPLEEQNRSLTAE